MNDRPQDMRADVQRQREAAKKRALGRPMLPEQRKAPERDKG